MKAGLNGVFQIKPFYDPALFKMGANFLSGTSLAALTYIGFDGSPPWQKTRLIPNGICFGNHINMSYTGLISSIQLYLFKWHGLTGKPFSNLDTAYLDIMQLVGGSLLFGLFSVVMSISQFGCGMSGQVVQRDYYMEWGRDNIFPRKIFGYLSPQKKNPSRNIMILGVLVFFGSLYFPWNMPATCLILAHFLGYMGLIWPAILSLSSSSYITNLLLFAFLFYLFYFSFFRCCERDCWPQINPHISLEMRQN